MTNQLSPSEEVHTTEQVQVAPSGSETNAGSSSVLLETGGVILTIAAIAALVSNRLDNKIKSLEKPKNAEPARFPGME